MLQRARLLPILFGIVACFTISSNVLAEGTLLLRTPSVNDDHVVFVYAGDIWIADADGTNPRRLTIDEGAESNPYLSPDGQWVAFTGEYDGNTDIYVVSTKGGSPSRVTYHPEPDVIRGWTPEGDILFRSYRTNETRRYGRLYTVSPKGGFPEAVILPKAERGSFSPDMSKIAYMPVADATNTWKRYRGGRTTMIWVYDFASMDYVEIPRDNSNDTYPCYIGDKVYFLSDRNFTMNVFEYDVASQVVTQVTTFEDFDVKNLTTDGKRLAFEQAGMIHVYSPETEALSTITVSINPDLPYTRPHWKKVHKQIRTVSLSPSGVRGLFEARGDIFTVPAENGEIRNLTRSSGAHDRYPAWSPNGDKIAWLSDMAGEYDLYLIDQKGETEPVKIDLPDNAFYYYPTWSPDGTKILFNDDSVSLFYIDVEKGKPVLIDRDTESSLNASADWSPDSRYIAYAKTLPNHYRAIFVYDTENGTSRQVTDGMSDAISPTFSRDGNYLFFAASTNYALNISGLDMSSYDRDVERSIYCIVLDSESPSPFAPKSDEEDVKSADESDDEDESEEIAEDEDAVVIDYVGLSQRILALDEPEANYWDLQAAEGGYLFFMKEAEGSGNTLRRFDMGEEEGKDFLTGIGGFEISANGEKLIYIDGRSYGIVEVKGSPSKGDGKLDVGGMEMYLNPRKEWAQMYDEAWRVERDFFYDPNMHGADWPGIREKYRPFLDHVGSRDDLNNLFSDMIGELVVGHAYVFGGDTPDVPSVKTGLLGADYEIENDHYRISKIYSGLNWNPDLRAPLTEPGIDVHQGDYLLAVNGTDISTETSIFRYFENTAGQQTVLLVNDKPTRKNAREATVLPVSSERSLRLLNWVEANRKKVDEATDGKVAYIYLPNTGGAGYTYFNRYFFSQLDKDAAIIDERYNGGGSVADYMIDMMSRPLINYWAFRDSVYTASPYASMPGPKVMIINQNAGSGGDWLPMAFRQRGLGKLVGRRTWGGLVGIGGSPSLVDGGAVTAPRFGIFSLDGEWIVEDQGIAPDIEVYQTPKEMIEGGDPQLDKAIEVILEELEGYTPPTPNPEPHPTRAAPWK
ncbi:PDZ domain-containing protein [bacterium]|nr:PDZ domain-containing protein [bacterium]